jgi:hypothetical protein
MPLQFTPITHDYCFGVLQSQEWRKDNKLNGIMARVDLNTLSMDNEFDANSHINKD